MKTGRSRKKFKVSKLFTKADFKTKLLNKPSATFLLCPGHSFATVFVPFEVNLYLFFVVFFFICFFICFFVLSLILGY